MGAAPATVSVRLEGHSSVAQDTEDGVRRGSSTLLTMQEEPDDAALNHLNQDAFIKVESELHNHNQHRE